MLWIMLTFFGTVILVNGALAYFAISSWTGLVVPNSYVASQSFNEDTASRLEALNKGATAKVSVKNRFVLLQFAGKQSEALSAVKLNATLRHPVDAKKEIVIEFEVTGAGTYRAVTAIPDGTWVGDIKGEIEGYGRWAEAVRFSMETKP